MVIRPHACVWLFVFICLFCFGPVSFGINLKIGKIGETAAIVSCHPHLNSLNNIIKYEVFFPLVSSAFCFFGFGNSQLRLNTIIATTYERIGQSQTKTLKTSLTLSSLSLRFYLKLNIFYGYNPIYSRAPYVKLKAIGKINSSDRCQAQTHQTNGRKRDGEMQPNS